MVVSFFLGEGRSHCYAKTRNCYISDVSFVGHHRKSSRCFPHPLRRVRSSGFPLFHAFLIFQRARSKNRSRGNIVFLHSIYLHGCLFLSFQVRIQKFPMCSLSIKSLKVTAMAGDSKKSRLHNFRNDILCSIFSISFFLPHSVLILFWQIHPTLPHSHSPSPWSCPRKRRQQPRRKLLLSFFISWNIPLFCYFKVKLHATFYINCLGHYWSQLLGSSNIWTTTFILVKKIPPPLNK